MKPLTKLFIFCSVLALTMQLGTINCYAQWQQTAGPQGGIISCFTASGGNIFAGTFCGIYISSDTGSTWKPVNNGVADTYITSLATEGNTVFAGTQKGVFTTTDNGSSWQSANNGMMTQYGPPLVRTLLTVGDTVFVASDNLYVSGDGGASWQLRDSSSSFSGYSIDVMAQEGGMFVAMVWYQGIFISYDRGNSWNKVSSMWGDEVAINKGRIFITDGIYYTYASTDSGETWVDLGNGSNTLQGTMESFLTVGEYIIVGTGYGIYRSADNGFNWTQVATNLQNPVNNPESFVAALGVLGNTIFAGTGEVDEGGYITGGQGIYTSPDTGITWNSSYTGVNSTCISALFATDTALYAGTYGQGFYTSHDNGNSWQEMNSGLGDFRVRNIAAGGGYIYAVTWGGIYSSNNNGNTWIEANSGISSAPNLIAVGRTKILAGTDYSTVYSSSDQGVTWSAADNGISETGVSGLVSLSGDTFMAACGSQNYISFNGGLSWDSITGVSWTFSSALLKGDTIFAISALAGTGFYFSTNYGISWTAKSVPFTFNDMLLLRRDTFYSMGLANLYLSSDEGTSWQAISNAGMADSNYWSLAANNDYLFAGTYASSVWRWTPGEAIATGTETWKVGNGQLTIYPNPSEGQFRVSDLGFRMVKAEVFNLLGAIIESNANNQISNSIELDLTGEPAGVYFVRVYDENGNFRTGKVVKN